MWTAGAQEGKSAAARFDGEKWHTYSETEGLVGREIHAGLVAANGDVWFGDRRGAGVMRYDGTTWKVYTTEDGLINGEVLDIVQTPDGALWFGTQGGISRFDGERWTEFTPGDAPDRQRVVTLCVTRDGSLLGGPGSMEHVEAATRGVVRYDGKTWRRYGEDEGPIGDWVAQICEGPNGLLWLGLPDIGISSFDGERSAIYRTDEMPPIAFRGSRGRMTVALDGSVWLQGDNAVARFRPEFRDPPRTVLEQAPKHISSAGNIQVKWSGRDLWDDTPPDRLRFQWRLEGEAWSPQSERTDFTFTELSSGGHRLEVRAVDRDGNVDPTPAVHTFIVEAPWWGNPVVAGPGLLILAFAVFQTVRVVHRDRRLQESVHALSDANKELFQVNVDLQREQVLERLRGQAQGMQSSEDIGSVLEAVNRELNGLGLPIYSSSIDTYISETELERWSTAEDGQALEPYVRGVADHREARREARRRGDDYYHSHTEPGEVRGSILRGLAKGNPRFKGIPEERWPEKIERYFVFFDGGCVQLRSEEPIAEEYLMLTKRFGEVFGYAHSRHKELQEKEAQNRRLAVEASVQRLRAEVQSMDEASDFERILSLLTESLKTVELTFDGCEIDVLGEPVENPTMDLFEQAGFKYTTYRLDPDGNVAPRSYNVAAPFPTVIEQTVERFIAGEPWQGTSEGQAIVEVPAGAYGRLRLTASERDSFTDDEVATLREFADAVALGYARYLDIREIQNQTERKSAFLASMSHELRTPMNAIKGFANLILRRETGGMSERAQENLGKIDQASNHLLAMLNDLLDLSKIEAGRMDVNPERFDVGELVTSACDTVSPLIQEGVELHQDVADDIGEANTDKARLQQMVINLLSNAIKFTDSGSVTVNASAENGLLVIAVSDTGKGIPADELPTIFDEYRQAEGSESAVQKGTGLGLSITKKFSELLGGTIGVESEVGKGSTFTMRVPVEYPSEI